MSFNWLILGSTLLAGAASTVVATLLAEKVGKIGLIFLIFGVPVTIGLVPGFLIMAEAPIQDPSTASNALVLTMIGCNLATYFVESDHSEQ